MRDSCGHLGGRPRCVTVCRRGVRSLAFLDQFRPTILIKLSTAKVRRFLNAAGLGDTSHHGLGHPRAYTVNVGQAKIQLTGP